MRAVRRVAGRTVVLDRANVDTDQIIPAAYLKRITRTGFAEGLFAAWRKDPAFPLNDPKRRGASILVAGANFGCGSSREHAPWALDEHGFRAIVAPSFADIFRGNCLKIGLVPVALPEVAVRSLMRVAQADPALEVVVDLERRVVEVPKLRASTPFEMDDFTRRRLLEGLDDVALTLSHEHAIASYEAAHR